MTRKGLRTHLLEDPAQRRALGSPLRLEILGLFTTKEPLSVAEMAERIGRPAASLYYHVRLLEKVGILTRAGERSSGPREEALYHPIAERFALPTDPESGEGVADATKTLASAFRMAERDFAAAMQSAATPSTTTRSTGIHTKGPLRNMFATRVHCRLDKDALRELNQHLRAIERLVARTVRQTGAPEKGDQYLSLTLALLPLRGRHTE